MAQNLNNSVSIIKKFRTPITAPQLFQPISTVFLDNLTYEEQLLGIFKKLNEVIGQVNTLSEAIAPLPELEEAFQNLQTYVTNEIVNIMNQLTTGDVLTLQAAKDYTDTKLAELDPMCKPSGIAYGALTAAEYDSLNLTAEAYDELQFTAYYYDYYGKYYFFGEDGTVFISYINLRQVKNEDVLWELRSPPVKANLKYLVQISLGDYDGSDVGPIDVYLNKSVPDLLEIPNAGDSTIATTFTTTDVSNGFTVSIVTEHDAPFTIADAFIKIKPLGEFNGSL